MGMAPTERLKLRRQMAAAAGKKEYNFLVLVHGNLWLDVEEELSTMALNIGQKEFGQVNAARTKRSVDEANSRSSEVEAGEVSCRCGDV